MRGDITEEVKREKREKGKGKKDRSRSIILRVHAWLTINTKQNAQQRAAKRAIAWQDSITHMQRPANKNGAMGTGIFAYSCLTGQMKQARESSGLFCSFVLSFFLSFRGRCKQTIST